MPDTDPAPGRFRKAAFWVLLGLTSAVFAELLFPNTPLGPLLLVIVPVYLLHAVFLAGLAFRFDRVTYPSLYLFGVLFGLWETYITKVAWAPENAVSIGVEVAGVFWLRTLSLVLFWHPLVAFVIPVMVVELVATDSDRSLVPPLAGRPYSPYLAAGAGASLALFQGGVPGVGPAVLALSNAVALVVLLGSLFAWRRSGGHEFSMAALLPTGRQLWAVGIALVGLYVVLGATFRGEQLPGRPLPHLAVLALYVAVGATLLASLRWVERTEASVGVTFSWRLVLGAALAAFLLSLGGWLVGTLVPTVSLILFLSFFFGGLVIGAANLALVGLRLTRGP